MINVSGITSKRFHKSLNQGHWDVFGFQNLFEVTDLRRSFPGWAVRDFGLNKFAECGTSNPGLHIQNLFEV